MQQQHFTYLTGSKQAFNCYMLSDMTDIITSNQTLQQRPAYSESAGCCCYHVSMIWHTLVVITIMLHYINVNNMLM